MATATIIAAQYVVDGVEFASAVTLYNVSEATMNDLRWEAHWRNRLVTEIHERGHTPDGEITWHMWTAEVPEGEEE